MHTKTKGFSLIEILISMMLISFSGIFLMKCMIASLQGMKNSNLRFTLTQFLKREQNIFLGMNFQSEALSECNKYTKRYGKILLKVKIRNISGTLKKITLNGTMHGFKRSIVFYKSGLIREK